MFQATISVCSAAVSAMTNGRARRAQDYSGASLPVCRGIWAPSSCWTDHWRSATFSFVKKLFGGVALVILAGLGASPVAGQAGNLVVYGDVVYFYPPGNARNCILNSQFKRGEPVGFRMTSVDSTGKRDRAAQLVVHLSYAGKTLDIPMRDRQTATQPEREFWVAKWMVPDDAPMGIVRFTVSAKDSQGRTGEYKPFEVQASQITIVP